jgi:hypothetical protein
MTRKWVRQLNCELNILYRYLILVIGHPSTEKNIPFRITTDINRNGSKGSVEVPSFTQIKREAIRVYVRTKATCDIKYAARKTSSQKEMSGKNSFAIACTILL